MRDTKDAQ